MNSRIITVYITNIEREVVMKWTQRAIRIRQLTHRMCSAL